MINSQISGRGLNVFRGFNYNVFSEDRILDTKIIGQHFFLFTYNTSLGISFFLRSSYVNL